MIWGYVGPQGKGKSYWLTADVLHAMGMGMATVTNYPVVDSVTGGTAECVDLSQGLFPLYEFARDTKADFERDNPGRELEFPGVFAAVTEIHQIMPSAFWQKTRTVGAMKEISETRKNRMHLGWDAQYLDLVERWVRDNTEIVYECSIALRNPFRRDHGAMFDFRTGRKPLTPWIMRARGYRPKHVDLGEVARRGRRVSSRTKVFQIQVARSYDSYAVIRSLVMAGANAAAS